MSSIRTPDILLRQAAERLEAGDIPSAGCHAREALRRHLRAVCVAHAIAPKGRKHTSEKLANQLQAAGILDAEGKAHLRQVLRTFHRAAHLYQIPPNRMQRTIDEARAVIG